MSNDTATATATATATVIAPAVTAILTRLPPTDQENEISKGEGAQGCSLPVSSLLKECCDLLEELDMDFKANVGERYRYNYNVHHKPKTIFKKH